MSFSLDIPSDYLKELFTYEFKDIAEEALKEAGPVLVESTKRAMRAAIRHDGDSPMVNSVKMSRVVETSTDAFLVTACPSGYGSNTYRKKNKGGSSRSYKVSNALKAIWLQYGVAGRQAPRDWLNAAVSGCEGKIMGMLQSRWEKMVGAE